MCPISPIKVHGGSVFLILIFPINFNILSETGKFIHTRYGILEIFKKSGLEKEALGNLFDLTRL